LVWLMLTVFGLASGLDQALSIWEKSSKTLITS
jgi:hypothetical protein